MRIETMRSSAPRIVAVNEAVIASADIAREVQNHEGISPVVAWEAAPRPAARTGCARPTRKP
jgi:peptidyl-prolyl cis-trans isomerase C